MKSFVNFIAGPPESHQFANISFRHFSLCRVLVFVLYHFFRSLSAFLRDNEQDSWGTKFAAGSSASRRGFHLHFQTHFSRIFVLPGKLVCIWQPSARSLAGNRIFRYQAGCKPNQTNPCCFFPAPPRLHRLQRNTKFINLMKALHNCNSRSCSPANACNEE